MTDQRREAPRVVWWCKGPDKGQVCELGAPAQVASEGPYKYIRADLAAELARECLEFVPDGHDYQQAVGEAQLWRRVIELEGKGDE